MFSHVTRLDQSRASANIWWILIDYSYYMALSHKDWELPNLRIWLAEIDIESGLDFPI